MNRILIATKNAGKVREFKQALEAEGFEVLGMEQLSDQTEVEESGTTFEANARLKAEGYSSRTDAVVIADDSGIEVDALDGAPGVHSARFGGDGLDDDGRNALLLQKLEGVPEEKRSARFRCVLALARGGETIATFDGVIAGRINYSPIGSNGFGYDPLFFHPSSGCTTAELSPEAKRKVSHRGKAIATLVAAIRGGELKL